MNSIDISEQSIAERDINLLKTLLQDKTTKKYIKWATDHYMERGDDFQPEVEIRPELVIGIHANVIQPRVAKSIDSQAKRTRDMAEVFTPSWVCNQQNNLVDDAWFKRTGTFNQEIKQGWRSNSQPVVFPDDKVWKDYVKLNRLEISCGEAPYLVSRYDTVTGEYIPIPERIGLLDRKLRVINENIHDEEIWNKWAIKAYQSTYGYDYQGDNVLLARENLFNTYIDNMQHQFGHEPSLAQLRKIANIIAWNIWQMDGLTMTVPFSESQPAHSQITMFDTGDKPEKLATPCRIYDWKAKKNIEFKSLLKGKE